MERKLAVILAADVVGYSAHMERDEAGTFARVRAVGAEVFEPEIERHRGRIFKVMGDGILAEFGSVVDAVECAVALQHALAQRNADLPETEHIRVRIGINLGEVIVEGDDRYGEGVNIATRLEQLAEPGGIWVSGKVAKEVEKKLAFGFEPMGERRVKNIIEPVPVYRVKRDGALARRMMPAAWRPAWLRTAVIALAALLVGGAAWFMFANRESHNADVPAVVEGKPSLAVLPFTNLSDDKAQGYVAEGMADDLTTELSRVPDLFVVSHNAVLVYKERAVPLAQIGKELGVRYLVEGSTRRAGDELRMNAQLIDTQTGGNIWAERFNGKWADIFSLQDRIVGQIASALRLRLAANQLDMAGGTKNVLAYDHYLRGQTLQKSADPADWAKAVANFEQAVALDPEFGQAAAKLAWMYYSARSVKSKQSALQVNGDEAESRGAAFFAKAAKHPSATYYQLLAENLLYQQQTDEAVAAAGRAIALDPSDPWGHEEMGFALILNGRPEDGRNLPGYRQSARSGDRCEMALPHRRPGGILDGAVRSRRLAAREDRRFDGCQLILGFLGHLHRLAIAGRNRWASGARCDRREGEAEALHRRRRRQGIYDRDHDGGISIQESHQFRAPCRRDCARPAFRTSANANPRNRIPG